MKLLALAYVILEVIMKAVDQLFEAPEIDLEDVE
jgi:hypothetical protein